MKYYYIILFLDLALWLCWLPNIWEVSNFIIMTEVVWVFTIKIFEGNYFKCVVLKYLFSLKTNVFFWYNGFFHNQIERPQFKHFHFHSSLSRLWYCVWNIFFLFHTLVTCLNTPYAGNIFSQDSNVLLLCCQSIIVNFFFLDEPSLFRTLATMSPHNSTIFCLSFLFFSFS